MDPNVCCIPLNNGKIKRNRCYVHMYVYILTYNYLIKFFMQQAELIALERTSLLALRQDHEAFFKFTSGLDAAARERLESENIRLTKVHEQIGTKERELYEMFRKDQVLYQINFLL